MQIPTPQETTEEFYIKVDHEDQIDQLLPLLQEKGWMWASGHEMTDPTSGGPDSMRLNLRGNAVYFMLLPSGCVNTSWRQRANSTTYSAHIFLDGGGKSAGISIPSGLGKWNCKCSRCGKDAYQGFMRTECSNGDCK